MIGICAVLTRMLPLHLSINQPTPTHLRVRGERIHMRPLLYHRSGSAVHLPSRYAIDERESELLP